MLVRKVGIWSLAKTFAFFYAGLGMLFGLGVLVIGWIILVTSGDSGGWGIGGPELLFLAAWAFIGMPVVAAIKGLVVGALSALLFNFAAGLKGGFEIDLVAGG